MVQLTDEEIKRLEGEKSELQAELAAEEDESFKELILKDIAQIDAELGQGIPSQDMTTSVRSSPATGDFKIITNPKTGEAFMVPKDQAFYIFPGESEPTRIID